MPIEFCFALFHVSVAGCVSFCLWQQASAAMFRFVCFIIMSFEKSFFSSCWLLSIGRPTPSHCFCDAIQGRGGSVRASRSGLLSSICCNWQLPFWNSFHQHVVVASTAAAVSSIREIIIEVIWLHSLSGDHLIIYSPLHTAL